MNATQRKRPLGAPRELDREPSSTQPTEKEAPRPRAATRRAPLRTNSPYTIL